MASQATTEKDIKKLAPKLLELDGKSEFIVTDHTLHSSRARGGGGSTHVGASRPSHATLFATTLADEDSHFLLQMYSVENKRFPAKLTLRIPGKEGNFEVFNFTDCMISDFKHISQKSHDGSNEYVISIVLDARSFTCQKGNTVSIVQH